MGNIRPVIKNNEYQISKHEFYAAYHYALQYSEWKDMITAIASIDTPDPEQADMPHAHSVSDTTFNKAVKIGEYRDRMRVIEDLVRMAAPDIYVWLLKAVTTEGCSYTYLNMRMNIPCGKNYYYDKRRKFYYLLSKYMNEGHRGQ